VSRFLMAHQHN